MFDTDWHRAQRSAIQTVSAAAATLPDVTRELLRDRLGRFAHTVDLHDPAEFPEGSNAEGAQRRYVEESIAEMAREVHTLTEALRGIELAESVLRIARTDPAMRAQEVGPGPVYAYQGRRYRHRTELVRHGEMSTPAGGWVRMPPRLTEELADHIETGRAVLVEQG